MDTPSDSGAWAGISIANGRASSCRGRASDRWRWSRPRS
ncbi:hypothetical protein TMO_b0318 (plasmid) [Tistrella mobilis KA081020-065]|uniref:Uncharacterized protein n=1 Tax=Tistrella mobilis (strain KA081020-065) TaxID=1110502 RepID=I3TU88_TISMK|nr:hypothetical protein TMO_b0318 [Tistrella mobilis KA081020-065]